METNQKDNLEPMSEFTPTNTYQHMKSNIVNCQKNCKENPNETYYCIQCKNTFSKSDLEKHTDHLMLLKEQIYELQDSFLREQIEKTSNYDEILKLKEETFKALETSFNQIKNELAQLYHSKKKEIEDVFTFAINNLKSINGTYQNLQNEIKSFYSNHNDFFAVKNQQNLDEQNTVFLMKIELMNIFEQQNKRTFDGVNQLKNNLFEYKNDLTIKTNLTIKALNEYFKNIFDSMFSYFIT